MSDPAVSIAAGSLPEGPAAPKPARRDPVADADQGAIEEARALLGAAGHAALSWQDAVDGSPGISRIAFALDPELGPLTLVSALAPHAAALKTHPACALMVGEVGAKGDPMTHPRLMIRARAEYVAADDPRRAAIRDRWLQRNPKAKIYIDLGDFSFVRLAPTSGLLNGGFGRAFRFTADDLA